MKKKNNDGKIVLILIIALIAFAIGASIGINLSLHGFEADDNETQEINVTENMTTNTIQSTTFEIIEPVSNTNSSKHLTTT